MVDTLGHLLALHMTPADRQDRTQVKWIAKVVQCATGRNVELAYVDQSFTGEQVVEDADDHGFSLQVVTLPQARSGFVLLPRRWVIERTFAGMARLRRLAKDFERLPKTVEGPHLAVFACIMLARYFAESAQHAPSASAITWLATEDTPAGAPRAGLCTAGLTVGTISSAHAAAM